MMEVMGETLRPGGFKLTERAVQFCKLCTEDTVLDLGCGQGATVCYLNEKHNIKAVGIDISEKLISIARKKYRHADFTLGTGENMPFEEESFGGVFAECTLSLMDDLDSTLKEVFRVLKKYGWFVITDVYARNPGPVKELEKFTLNSCMRGLHDLDMLKEKLVETGFEIMLFEDCSYFLRELLVKIIFTYGSMGVFWNITADGCVNGCRFQETLASCKPGYFIIIARKGGMHYARYGF
jgi:ubiquinone/menaquinone biosynthesis C-methylase UbiE